VKSGDQFVGKHCGVRLSTWVIVNLSSLIMTALNGDELPNYICFAPEE